MLCNLKIWGYQESVAFKPNETSTMSDSNRRPVAFNIYINATHNGPVAFALNASDPDEDRVQYDIVANPSDGNISSSDSSSGGGVYSPGCKITTDSGLRQDSFAFNALDSNGAAAYANELSLVTEQTSYNDLLEFA